MLGKVLLARLKIALLRLLHFVFPNQRQTLTITAQTQQSHSNINCKEIFLLTFWYQHHWQQRYKFQFESNQCLKVEFSPVTCFWITFLLFYLFQGCLKHDKKEFHFNQPIHLESKLQHMYWLLFQKGLVFAASRMRLFNVKGNRHYIWCPTTEVEARPASAAKNQVKGADAKYSLKRVSITEWKCCVTEYLQATRNSLSTDNEFKGQALQNILPVKEAFEEFQTKVAKDEFMSKFGRHLAETDRCFSLETLGQMIVDILMPFLRSSCFDPSGSSSINAMATWSRLLALAHPALAGDDKFQPFCQQLLAREGKVTGGSIDHEENTNIGYFVNQDTYSSQTLEEGAPSRYFQGFDTLQDNNKCFNMKTYGRALYNRKHLIMHFLNCDKHRVQSTYFVPDVRTDVLVGKFVLTYRHTHTYTYTFFL